MPITEDEIKEIISQPSSEVQKATTISTDGKTCLTRIPKEIVSVLNIRAGDKIQWKCSPKEQTLTVEVFHVSKEKNA